MCEFCKTQYNKHTICGRDIKISQCANLTDLTTAQIMRHEADILPGIVIFKGNKAGGYFDISYCPMCGRKLVEE